MSKHNIEVTIEGPSSYGSALSNYSDTYSSWDETETETCPKCFGTGLDRDEIFECENCYGEGVLIPLDAALDS